MVAFIVRMGDNSRYVNDFWDKFMATSKKRVPDNVIVLNKKARFDYEAEETFEAGIVLEGWEVKSLREKKVQVRDSYVLIKDGEAWLLNAVITPLATVSTHIIPEPSRTRKLLLHEEEIKKLIGAVERKGYTLVPLKLYWKNNRAKCLMALARGKKTYDKRETIKRRDWDREKARVQKMYR